MEIQTLVEVMDLKQHGLSITVTQGNRVVCPICICTEGNVCLWLSGMYCIWLYCYYLCSKLEIIMSSADWKQSSTSITGCSCSPVAHKDRSWVKWTHHRDLMFLCITGCFHWLLAGNKSRCLTLICICLYLGWLKIMHTAVRWISFHPYPKMLV